MIQNRNGLIPGEKAITTDKLVPIHNDIKKLDERVSNLEECCDKLDEELVTEKIIVDDIQVNGKTYTGDIESSGVHCACGFVGNSTTVTDITTDNITVNCCARIKDAHIEKAVIDNLTFEDETVDDMTINCHLHVNGSSCFTNTINGNITNADTATNLAANPIIHSCDGLTYDEWGTKFCVQVGDKCSNEISVTQAATAYSSETSNNAENADKFDFCSADDWRDYISSQIPTCAADTAKFAGKDCDEWKTIIKETCVDNAVSADTATNLASNPQLSLGSIDCCAITVTAGNMTSQEFIVPYASEASTAGLANNSTCFDGKTYAEACADILSGCAAKADEATCLKDNPVLSCNGSCIYVTAGNKNSNCITVPYSKCSAATLISASGADSTFQIVMDSTAGNASGYHSFIKDCGNNLTYNPSKDLLQTLNITATNCLKGDLVCAKTCITTPKAEATCIITCGVCNNGNSNINGDVNIGGDLYVTGTAHYTHSEEVITESENIILRDGATTPVASGHYSGFVVTNYDGNGNDLEVGADSAGTLKIGTCAANMEAVATRDDSDNMEDSYATKWCASCKKIVTSGIACTHDLYVNGDACATGSVTANAFCGSLVGNADTATNATCFDGHTYADACTNILSGNAACASKLSTAHCINGTAFDGTCDITTTKWGTTRNVQISDCDGTNISGTVSVDGSANVCLKLPSTIKATLTGKADTAKAVTTCPTTVNATCYVTLSANNTAGDKQIYTNTNLKYNPSTGALTATTFCGSFAGTSDNATCFDGKTYSCACADIRSGLTSCTGTVTGVTVNGVTGTGTGAITVSNVPACGGCADTADCSKTVCVVADNTDSAYAVPLVNGWNGTTIANAILKGSISSNRQLTFNPAQGVLNSRFVHVVCNVKTPVVTSVPTADTATDIVFCTHKADNTWLDTVKMSSNGLLCGRLYGVGSTSNYNFKIPFSSATGGLTSGTVSCIVHLNHVDSQDTFTYNPATNTLRVGIVCGALCGNVNMNNVTDATSIHVCANTVTRKSIITNQICGVGYVSRAAIGLSRGSSGFGTVLVSVGTNDAGTTFCDYCFSPNGVFTATCFCGTGVTTSAVYSPQTNGTVTGTEFYGHRADNTNKIVACANGNGLYRALYGECGNANYKIPFTTLSGTTASGTTSLSLDRVTTADTFTYNAMCNVLRVGTVCGALKTGAYVECTTTTSGQAGTYVVPGGIEIMQATPYVDFHHNNACADYSARLINSAVGRFDLIVNNATGCCALTRTSTFSLYCNGTLTASNLTLQNTSSVGSGVYLKVGTATANENRNILFTPAVPGNNSTSTGEVQASTACPLTFNPATGVLTAKCFCGCVTATGTIDNATCFDGCTYASAKTDIRSGLTSCTGTVTISNSNANSSIPVALCTGSTSVGKSTGNALCYNPFTGALCARQFNSTTTAIAIGNICGDASASGNCSIAIGCGVASVVDKSIAIGNDVKTFSCGSAVVCSVVGCTATIFIPQGTKRCDAYKLLFTDTNNSFLFNGMYWSAIGQSTYKDSVGQYSSITRLSYSHDANAFYANGFPIWNGATNVELTIDTFQATDTTTTLNSMIFTYTRMTT